MANGHGGPRTPSKPAPASGPGRLSRRTDGGPAQQLRALSGGAYGDRQEFDQAQRAAPMAASGPGMAPQGPEMALQALLSGVRGPLPVTDFDAPTERPDEPVTAGSPLGPGPGPEALDGPRPGDTGRADAEILRSYLPVFEFLANLPTSSPSTRAAVQQIKGNLT